MKCRLGDPHLSVRSFRGPRHRTAYELTLNGEKVAYAEVSKSPTSRWWYIQKLNVVPEFRGGGCGRALMQYIEGKARKAGVQDITLESVTQIGFQSPRGFYEKMGYTDIYLEKEGRRSRDFVKRLG